MIKFGTHLQEEVCPFLIKRWKFWGCECRWSFKQLVNLFLWITIKFISNKSYSTHKWKEQMYIVIVYCIYSTCTYIVCTMYMYSTCSYIKKQSLEELILVWLVWGYILTICRFCGVKGKLSSLIIFTANNWTRLLSVKAYKLGLN